MGKALNTALVVGGLGVLGLMAYNALKGKTTAGGSPVSTLGGGSIFDLFDQTPSDTIPSSGQGGSSETTTRNYLNDVLDQLAKSGKAFVSPTGDIAGISMGGIYPALDVNEQGLYVNRQTGQVYPVDPATGRQRARVNEKGEVVGRYIASRAGVPYGTYEYEVIPESGITEHISEEVSGLPGGMTVTHKRTTTANVLITSKATGTKQAALVGTNPSTGEAWVWHNPL